MRARHTTRTSSSRPTTAWRSKQQQQQRTAAAATTTTSTAATSAPVFRAVAAGEPAARVRELIEQYASARGPDEYQQRSSAAVEYKSSSNRGETPLLVAHDRLYRGDLVGALLENGADAKALGPNCDALALAVHHGLIETMRALLRSGRHKANEHVWYGRWSDIRVRASGVCSIVHVAVVPQARPDGSDASPPPQTGALEVLVREFGANVDRRDAHGRRPLHWAVSEAAPGHRERAVDALISLGADVNAGDYGGRTPIVFAAHGDPSMVPRLLSLGASADVLDRHGWSPLMDACFSGEPTARVAVPALLRASSRETRRAVEHTGMSAIDYLVKKGHWTQDWCQDVISELLSSGVSVHPRPASLVLPTAARHGARLEPLEAALPPLWERQEAMVELAFDFQDLRAADEGVRVRERRVQELEEELRALGVGTEDTDESGNEEDEGGEEEGGNEEEEGGGEEGGGESDEEGDEEEGGEEEGREEEGGGEEDESDESDGSGAGGARGGSTSS